MSLRWSMRSMAALSSRLTLIMHQTSLRLPEKLKDNTLKHLSKDASAWLKFIVWQCLLLIRSEIGCFTDCEHPA